MQEMEPITRDEFESWKNERITQRVFELLRENVKDKSEFMAAGGLVGKDCEVKYSNMVGYIAALEALLNIDLADVGVGYDH